MAAIWADPRGASIQHLAERQEVDLAADLEPAHPFIEDDEPVGANHRGEDAGTVARELAGDPAAGAIGLESGAEVFAPLRLLAVREAGAHAVGARHDVIRPGEAEDQRARQGEERHHYGDRVARQAHEGDAANLTERHWPAGLDGEAPEMERAERLDGCLDVILLAGRHAARGDHQIVPRSGGGESVADRRRMIWPDAEIGHGTAEPLEQGRDRMTACIVDAT